MRPSILLTNDDGVNSIGLWAAYDALKPIADVTVVAPATQQSAVGRSISIFEAVIIGLYSLMLKPVMVVSGINIGENLSTESIMTSGTVGAALEAANQGPKAIAFSLQVEDQGDKFDDPRYYAQSFDAVRNVVRDVVERVLLHGFCPDTDVINVNIPSQIKGGYEVTRLAHKLFHTGVEKRLDPRGRPYFWINGPLIADAEEGTDVHAIKKGNISITPITLDCTAYKACEKIQNTFS